MRPLHELLTADGQRGITAVLGPTNTGKTHLALERMVRHRSAMIGLPLRLLAREVYDKLVARVGAHQVALITGEEKVVPARPRLWVCTVEAMPVDKPVAFLAVDEIQLATHRTRGHTFTDRLLHARGVVETLFLGSDAMAPLVEELVPTAEIVSQPRLSKLRFSGHHKLTRLPRRTAVVAFSAAQVYAIAEQLRRKHGGAAVVLGALSPRTRNAQVAMYQAGEVPFLVATDAIGMGLNMDVDHVAFAAVHKFDGRSRRMLHDDELAQIAGRAGRFLADGTFGTTADSAPLPPESVFAIESHRFPPKKKLWWRSAELDFSGPDALLDSLARRPPHRALRRMPDADDHAALEGLLQRSDLRGRLVREEDLRLLWEVARIPDYRKTLTGHHVDLLEWIFTKVQDEGALPPDAVASRIDRLDRTEGEIDALMTRMAHIRTWTYIGQRRSWLHDPDGVQARAREIEDKLSDALHTQLTARFVDHRLVTLPPGAGPVEVTVEGDELQIGDKVVGTLAGLEARPVAGATTAEREAVARRAEEVARSRVMGLVRDADHAFEITDEGRIAWHGHPVGALDQGERLDRPRVRLHEVAGLDDGHRAALRERLQRVVDGFVLTVTAPLRRKASRTLSGAAASLVDAVQAGLGAVSVDAVAKDLQRLTKTDRSSLARLDVRLGQRVVYVASTLKPGPRRVRAILWRAARGGGLAAPAGNLTSAPADGPPDFYLAVGFPVVGGVAVRADTLERVAAAARKAGRRGPFAMPEPIPSWLGADKEIAARVLVGLGYRRVAVAGEDRFVPQAARAR